MAYVLKVGNQRSVGTTYNTEQDSARLKRQIRYANKMRQTLFMPRLRTYQQIRISNNYPAYSTALAWDDTSWTDQWNLSLLDTTENTAGFIATDPMLPYEPLGDSIRDYYLFPQKAVLTIQQLPEKAIHYRVLAWMDFTEPQSAGVEYLGPKHILSRRSNPRYATYAANNSVLSTDGYFIDAPYMNETERIEENGTFDPAFKVLFDVCFEFVTLGSSSDGIGGSTITHRRDVEINIKEQYVSAIQDISQDKYSFPLNRPQVWVGFIGYGNGKQGAVAGTPVTEAYKFHCPTFFVVDSQYMDEYSTEAVEI